MPKINYIYIYNNIFKSLITVSHLLSSKLINIASEWLVQFYVLRNTEMFASLVFLILALDIDNPQFKYSLGMFVCIICCATYVQFILHSTAKERAVHDSLDKNRRKDRTERHGNSI